MYFSQIRVSPQDSDLLYTVDQQVAKSRDGGQTWQTLSGFGHVDQHAIWINPDNHDHLIIGNDGSIDVSYDQGVTWESPQLWAVGSALSRLSEHGAPLPRLHRPAGQRHVVWSEFGAGRSDPPTRLVPCRRG